MPHHPLVTIGLPLYNAERHVADALDSLLAQDYPNVEIIISDNASTDQTLAICVDYAARDPRIAIHRNEQNLGAHYNFTRVLELASGSYFMWAAHDDRWEPSYISKCLAKLQESPSAVACCTELTFLNQDGSPKREWRYDNLETVGASVPERVHELVSRMGWFAIYSLMRTEVARQIPIRDVYGTDVLFLLELLLRGDIAKVPEPLFHYRVSAKSAQDYLQDIHGKAADAPERPYTGLAQALWRIVQDSALDPAEKRVIARDFLETLSFQNLEWRNHLLQENGAPSPPNPEALRRYVGTLLGASRSAPGAGRRAMVFFPHNPYPARTGVHQRCLSFIQGLQTMGYEVTLYSSDLFTDNPWDVDAIRQAEEDLSIQVEIYWGTSQDRQYLSQVQRGFKGAVNWDLFCPPGLKEDFRATFHRLKPELVVVNYTYWGALAIGPEFESAVTVMETTDLVSLNFKMRSLLEPRLANPDDPDLIAEDFFSRQQPAADPVEFEICDRFDYTIAISPSEAELIRAHAPNTRVLYLPVTFDVAEVANTYESSALLVIGNNPFNKQGLRFFTKRVLPRILEEAPDFRLDVVGEGGRQVAPQPGIQLQGYVPDLARAYGHSRFAVCPLIGGTGQQVKIVEAMAHGLPVVVLRNVAGSSPVRHGINGFIADDANEFAGYCLRLWHDPDLCRTLGEEARRTIAEHYSEQALLSGLSQLRSRCDGHAAKRPKVVIDGVIFQLQAGGHGGISRVWRSLLPELVRQMPDWDFLLLRRTGSRPLLPYLPSRDVPAYDEATPEARKEDEAMLARVCAEEGADLFVSTYYTHAPGLHNVAVAYDMIPERMGFDMEAPAWIAKRRAYGGASSFLAISHSTAGDLQAHYDIPAERISVCHLGVDESFFPASEAEISAFRRKFGLEGPYFLMVGNRGLYKNGTMAMQALAELPAGEEGHLLAIGGEARLLAPETRYADIVTLLPGLSDEDLRRAYSAAEGLLYPSRYEGFGLPVAEAMACGCPVITCHHSSLPEVADRHALFVDPDDPGAMRAAIRRLRDPECRESLRTGGLQHVRRFTWSATARAVREHLRRVVAADMAALTREELNQRGEARFAHGDLHAAIAAFERALELDPGFARAHNNLGVALWSSGAVDSSLAFFDRALELEPADQEAALNAAQAFVAAGRPGRAEQILLERLRHAPTDSEALELLEAVRAAQTFRIVLADENVGRLARTLAVCREAFTPAHNVAMTILAGQHAAALRTVLEPFLGEPGSADLTIVDRPYRPSELASLLKGAHLVLGSPWVTLVARDESFPAFVSPSANQLAIAQANFRARNWFEPKARLDVSAGRRWLAHATERWPEVLETFLAAAVETPDLALLLVTPDGQEARLENQIAAWLVERGHAPDRIPDVVLIGSAQYPEIALLRAATHWVDTGDAVGRSAAEALGLGVITPGQAPAGRTLQIRKAAPPLVSAIVSTYNAEDFIRGCLEDLEAQTIADRMEILVIDSGSCQNERDIVAEFQARFDNIRYFRTERESVYQAWNRGIRAAQGAYLTNANTDDRRRRDGTEVLVAALEDNPEAVVAYGDSIICTDPQQTFDRCIPHRYLKWPDFTQQSMLDFCYIGPHPVWRKSVHERHGYFDERYWCSADYEFWLRLAQWHPFIHVPALLGVYWQNEQSLSRQGDRPLEETRRIQQEYRMKYRDLRAERR